MYNSCTGCEACFNICPQKAIEMKEDTEGFLFPQIDKNKCTNCKLCENICPINKDLFNEKQKTCFAITSEDRTRMKSSSGGAFSLIAEYILKNNGYVCGASYNKDWNVEHIIIDNIKDLNNLRGSKYVQSRIGNSYNEIKNLLHNNKTVLFSGTPCQVAGLKSFLNRDYENLITIDIVCHGVPNQKTWQEFLKENFSDEKIAGINFRDKELGWNCQNIVVTTAQNKKINKTFMQGFSENLFLRKSCSDCKYSNLKRVGDITLGDFWGLEILEHNLYDLKGISLCITNTTKGEELIETISPQCTQKIQLPIEYTKYNSPLYNSFKPAMYRDLFFKQLPSKGFNKSFENSYHTVGILNFWWANNYGAICTAYALQEVIKQLGYAVKTINWVPKWFYDTSFLGGISDKFAHQYFNLTKLCHTKNELRTLNKTTSKFIVGSDQVWRYGVEQLQNWSEFKDYNNICFLSFAEADKPKIAYSASFATDRYEGSILNKELVKYALHRFQSISVREDSGVEICKNEFEVNATHTLDPVFLLDKSYWENIINTSKLNDKNYICYYILDNIYDKEESLDFLQKKFNKKCIDISKNFQMELQDWLYYIKNCDLLVADSFHGCCLAIIFNKPFICIKNPIRGKDRFESLFRLLGLENRFLNFNETLETRPDLLEEIDWIQVNSILSKEKEFSLNWLKTALECNIITQNNVQTSLNEGILTLFDEVFDNIENMIDKRHLYTEINNIIKIYDERITNLINTYDTRISILNEKIIAMDYQIQEISKHKNIIQKMFN